MKKGFSFILVLAVLVSMGSGAFADSAALPTADGTVRIYIDGILRERGVSVGNVTYISLDTLNRVYSLGLKYEYSKRTATMTVSDEGLDISQPLEHIYMDVNGGYIYNKDLFVISSGRCYIPTEVAIRILSVRGEVKDGCVYLRSDKAVYSSPDKEYYEAKYGKDNINWLSRLIYAEAMNQPMECLIAVGNVVLNRVADPKHYPSTVKDVIFDDVPVVQFEVTTTGGIYLEPDTNSVIAACLAYDGANFGEDSTFFLNLKEGDASWFEAELRFVCAYGNLDFYAMDWGK